ncbi:MAG: hypothetical protein AAGF95_20815 [Chloroflexota bacterium]
MFTKRLLSVGFLTAILFGLFVSSANAGSTGPSGLNCPSFVTVGDYFTCTFQDSSGNDSYGVASDFDLYVHSVYNYNGQGYVYVEAYSAGSSEVCVYNFAQTVKTCQTVNIYPQGAQP